MRYRIRSRTCVDVHVASNMVTMKEMKKELVVVQPDMTWDSKCRYRI